LTDMGLALWDECESWGSRLFCLDLWRGENVGVGKGSVRGMESRTPEGEDIGPGKDSVGGYN